MVFDSILYLMVILTNCIENVKVMVCKGFCLWHIDPLFFFLILFIYLFYFYYYFLFFFFFFFFASDIYFSVYGM